MNQGNAMECQNRDLRRILRQSLLTERLLGLDLLPFRLTPHAQSSGAGEVGRSKAAQEPACANFSSDVSVHSPDDNFQLLRVLDETKVRSCVRCELSAHRTQTVFGQGNAAARLVFVGEGPGYEEDKQGLAFVGPAGQLLTKMILAMGTTREEVYICNVVKCRPPGNRTPLAEEILACNPFLEEQLAIIRPEMIVALGAPAAKTLLNTAEPIGKLRGRFHEYRLPRSRAGDGIIPVMPTYHPAYLLRNPVDKRKAWADLQMVMTRLGLIGPRIG